MGTKYSLQFDGSFDVSKIRSSINEIQVSLNKLKLPESLNKDLGKDFLQLSEAFNKVQNHLTQGFTNTKEIRKSADDFTALEKGLKQYLQTVSKTQNIDLTSMIPDSAVKQINELSKAVENYGKELEKLSNTDAFSKANNELIKTQNALKDAEKRQRAAKKKIDDDANKYQAQENLKAEQQRIIKEAKDKQASKQKQIEKVPKVDTTQIKEQIKEIENYQEAIKKLDQLTGSKQIGTVQNMLNKRVASIGKSEITQEDISRIKTYLDLLKDSKVTENYNDLSNFKPTALQEIVDLYEKLSVLKTAKNKPSNNLDDLTKNLQEKEKEIEESEKQIEEYAKEIQEQQEIIEKAQKEIDKINNQQNSSKIATEKHKIEKGNIETEVENLKNNLAAAQTSLDNLNTANVNQAFEKIVQDLQKVGIEIPSTVTNIEQLKTYLESIKSDALKDVGKNLENISEKFEDVAEGAEAVNNFSDQIKEGSGNVDNFNRSLDGIKSRIQYFFGLSNAINLFKNAIRGAFQTVQELDKAMTETAVVTDFSVSDMWEQLPRYTETAKQLGVTTQGVYETMTLFYQQGLNQQETFALGTETLKMARIAGLDYATSTDYMTAALRGFNMELNESSAQRVNDVYSELAAITASDTREISVAMTKVASIANSANMEFETTAAFLSQIIETTRESAETAGTALKTVIARFSEVKSLYSEGQLIGTDEEGEAINVNKVSEALRAAGINLNEFLTGSKGLDQIFLELASKWDSLDLVTQRYIATMAAGSRQQSRFIAMMSDYDRTLDLVNAAQNSTGASQEQFEKTQESLESKLNNLKNAWNEFLMGLSDSNVIKGAVDLLTKLIEMVNNLTDSFGKTSSILKWISAIAGLGSLRKIFSKDGLFTNILGKLKDTNLGKVLGIGEGLGGGIFGTKETSANINNLGAAATNAANAENNVANAANNAASAFNNIGAVVGRENIDPASIDFSGYYHPSETGQINRWLTHSGKDFTQDDYNKVLARIRTDNISAVSMQISEYNTELQKQTQMLTKWGTPAVGVKSIFGGTAAGVADRKSGSVALKYDAENLPNIALHEYEHLMQTALKGTKFDSSNIIAQLFDDDEIDQFRNRLRLAGYNYTERGLDEEILSNLFGGQRLYGAWDDNYIKQKRANPIFEEYLKYGAEKMSPKYKDEIVDTYKNIGIVKPNINDRVGFLKDYSARKAQQFLIQDFQKYIPKLKEAYKDNSEAELYINSIEEILGKKGLYTNKRSNQIQDSLRNLNNIKDLDAAVPRLSDAFNKLLTKAIGGEDGREFLNEILNPKSIDFDLNSNEALQERIKLLDQLASEEVDTAKHDKYRQEQADIQKIIDLQKDVNEQREINEENAEDGYTLFDPEGARELEQKEKELAELKEKFNKTYEKNPIIPEDTSEEVEKASKGISKIGDKLKGISNYKWGNILSGAALGASFLTNELQKAEVISNELANGIQSVSSGMLAGAQVGGGWGALIGGAVSLLGYLKQIGAFDTKEQKALRKSQEFAEKTQEAYDSSKKKVEDLKTAVDTLSAGRASLDTLVSGTQAWKEQLSETNSQVQELIDKWPELSQYAKVDSNGALYIEDVEDRLEEAKVQLKNDEILNNYAQRKAERLALEASTMGFNHTDLASGKGSSRYVSFNDPTIQKLTDLYQQNGLGIFYKDAESGQYNKQVNNLINSIFGHTLEDIRAGAENGAPWAKIFNDQIDNYIHNYLSKLQAYENKELSSNVIDIEDSVTESIEGGGGILNTLATGFNEYRKQVESWWDKELTNSALIDGQWDSEKAYAWITKQLGDVGQDITRIPGLENIEYNKDIILNNFDQLKTIFSYAKTVSDSSSTYDNIITSLGSVEKVLEFSSFLDGEASGLSGDLLNYIQLNYPGTGNARKTSKFYNGLIKYIPEDVLKSIGIDRTNIDNYIEPIVADLANTRKTFEENLNKDLADDVYNSFSLEQVKNYNALFNSVKKYGEQIQEFLSNEILSGANNFTEAEIQAFSTLNDQTPIETVQKLNAIMKTGSISAQNFAKALLETSDSFNVISQLNQLWSSDEFANGYKEIGEIINKKGFLNTNDIHELVQEFPILSNFIENTGFEVESLATLFTDLYTGEIVLSDISNAALKTLASFKGLRSMVVDLEDALSNIGGTNENDVLDKVSGFTNTLKENIEKGAYSNSENQDIISALFGEDFFEPGASTEEKLQQAYKWLDQNGQNFAYAWSQFDFGKVGSFDRETLLDEIQKQLNLTRTGAEITLTAAINIDPEFKNTIDNAEKRAYLKELQDNIDELTEKDIKKASVKVGLSVELINNFLEGDFSIDDLIPEIKVDTIDFSPIYNAFFKQLSETNFASLFAPVESSLISIFDLLGDDAKQELMDAINSIDWSDPIAGAEELARKASEGLKGAKEAAASIKNEFLSWGEVGQLQWTFLQEGFQDTVDSVKDLIKTEGRISNTKVKNLANANKTLGKYIDNNTKRINALRKILTALANDKIKVNEITEAFIEAAESVTTFEDILSQAEDFIANFNPGRDFTESREFLEDNLEALKTDLENFDIGNEQFQGIYDAFFGKGAYASIVKGSNGIYDTMYDTFSEKITWLEGLLANQGKGLFEEIAKNWKISETNFDEQNVFFDTSNLTSKEFRQGIIDSLRKAGMNISEDMASVIFEAWQLKDPSGAQQLKDNDISAWIESYFSGGKTAISQSLLNLMADSFGMAADDLLNIIKGIKKDIDIEITTRTWFKDENGNNLEGNYFVQAFEDRFGKTIDEITNYWTKIHPQEEFDFVEYAKETGLDATPEEVNEIANMVNRAVKSAISKFELEGTEGPVTQAAEDIAQAEKLIGEATSEMTPEIREGVQTFTEFADAVSNLYNTLGSGNTTEATSTIEAFIGSLTTLLSDPNVDFEKLTNIAFNIQITGSTPEKLQYVVATLVDLKAAGLEDTNISTILSGYVSGSITQESVDNYAKAYNSLKGALGDNTSQFLQAYMEAGGEIGSVPTNADSYAAAWSALIGAGLTPGDTANIIKANISADGTISDGLQEILDLIEKGDTKNAAKALNQILFNIDLGTDNFTSQANSIYEAQNGREINWTVKLSQPQLSFDEYASKSGKDLIVEGTDLVLGQIQSGYRNYYNSDLIKGEPLAFSEWAAQEYKLPASWLYDNGYGKVIDTITGMINYKGTTGEQLEVGADISLQDDNPTIDISNAELSEESKDIINQQANESLEELNLEVPENFEGLDSLSQVLGDAFNVVKEDLSSVSEDSQRAFDKIETFDLTNWNEFKDDAPTVAEALKDAANAMQKLTTMAGSLNGFDTFNREQYATQMVDMANLLKQSGDISGYEQILSNLANFAQVVGSSLEDFNKKYKLNLDTSDIEKAIKDINVVDSLAEGFQGGANSGQDSIDSIDGTALTNTTEAAITTGAETGAGNAQTLLNGVDGSQLQSTIESNISNGGSDGASSAQSSINGITAGGLHGTVYSAISNAGISAAYAVQAALNSLYMPNLSIGGSGSGATGGYVASYASGTYNSRILSAGLALTGEEGAEIIWNKEKGYAYITGAKHPQFQNLQPGDRVFNAEETRKIMSGSAATGGKVPSYATGRFKLDDSDSGGGGGGGDGINDIADDLEEWRNELDWLYNLMEDIAELERDREKLQEEYNDLLKDQSANGRQLFENWKKQLGNLYTQLNHQVTALSKREQEMAEFMRDTNEFKDYLWYNWEDRTLEIDWGLIEALNDNDKETYDKIADLVSRAEEIQDKMDDAEDAIYDINNEIEELYTEWRDTFVDFEQRVYDAVVKSYQDIIDEYEDLNDTLENTNSQILDAISKEINLQRQIRDNTKTEEELTNDEARLAYLRRDTSGGNDLAALQLEKELNDARQDYADTLVDQALKRLEDDNDAAAEQRERQLEIMQAQLDYAEQSGEYWNYVSTLISDAMGDDGELLTNTRLESLLQNAESWKGMSETNKAVWEEELRTTFNEVAAWILRTQATDPITGEISGISDSIKGVSAAINAYSQAVTKYASEANDAISSAKSSANSSGYTSFSGGSGGTSSGETHGYSVTTLTGAKLTGTSASKDEARAYVNSLASKGITVKQYGVYESGGLNTSTGPAWLDGTPSKPEYVLNAQQTKAFLNFTDLLSNIMAGRNFNSGSTITGDTNLNISVSVDSIASDYDVDRLADRLKSEIVSSMSYRNVNNLSFKR